MPLKIIIVPVWKEKNEAIWGDFLKKAFFPLPSYSVFW